MCCPDTFCRSNGFGSAEVSGAAPDDVTRQSLESKFGYSGQSQAAERAGSHAGAKFALIFFIILFS